MSSDSNNQNLMSFVVEVCSTAVATIEGEPVVVIALRKADQKITCHNIAITASNAMRLGEDLATLFRESEILNRFLKEIAERESQENAEIMEEKRRRLRG